MSHAAPRWLVRSSMHPNLPLFHCLALTVCLPLLLVRLWFVAPSSPPFPGLSPHQPSPCACSCCW